MLSGGTITLFGGYQVDSDKRGTEVLKEGEFTVSIGETPYYAIKQPRSLFGRMAEWVKSRFK